MAESEEKLKSFLLKVKEESGKGGWTTETFRKLRLWSPIPSPHGNRGRKMETVTDFIFLGSKITVAKDREAWHAVVHGVAKSQISCNDWTTSEHGGMYIFLNFSFVWIYAQEWASMVAQQQRTHLPMQETWVQPLSRQDFPVEGNGYWQQYFCWKNPMDRGAWQSTVIGAAKELDIT